jgi:DNA-binding GntR family transcriptional regulator
MNSTDPDTKTSPRAAESISSRLNEIRLQVRSMIRDGTLKPGERVNEQALAAQLGVGRNTAREALRLLERSGLVHIVPNRGAEVRKITLEEALDLYDVRAGLARVAGRLAASRLAATEESKLVETMDSMRKALAERDGARYNTLNGTLHNLMMNAAKNARLLEINAGIEDELSLYLHKGVYSNSQMQLSLEEHQRMVDAVCNGRVAEAAEAFEAHIFAGKQRMLDTVSQSSGR